MIIHIVGSFFFSPELLVHIMYNVNIYISHLVFHFISFYIIRNHCIINVTVITFIWIHTEHITGLDNIERIDKKCSTAKRGKCLLLQFHQCNQGLTQFLFHYQITKTYLSNKTRPKMETIVWFILLLRFTFKYFVLNFIWTIFANKKAILE